MKHKQKRIVCFVLSLCLMFLATLPTYSLEEGRARSCNRRAKGKIALTFDDGPHPILTPKILAILEKYHVRATFFVIGVNIENYPDSIPRILELGCEVGNHTYTHRCVDKMSEEEIKNELRKTERALCDIYDYRIRSFRPPEGAYGTNLLKVAEEMQYRTVLWSIDTRDWDHMPPDQIARRVLSSVTDGDIILMHDYVGHNSPTCESLELFLPELLRRGYEFVTVSELLEEQ